MITKIALIAVKMALIFILYTTFIIHNTVIFGLFGWILGIAGHLHGIEGLAIAFISIAFAACLSIHITESNTKAGRFILITMGTMRYALPCGLIGSIIGIITSDFNGTFVFVESCIGFITGALLKFYFDDDLSSPFRCFARDTMRGINTALLYGAAFLIPSLFLAFVSSTGPSIAFLGLVIGILYGFVTGYRKAAISGEPLD